MLYNLKNFGNDYNKNSFMIPKHLRKYEAAFEGLQGDNKKFFAYNDWKAMQRAEKISREHGYGEVRFLYEIDPYTNRTVRSVGKIDKKLSKKYNISIKDLQTKPDEPAKKTAKLKNDTVFIKGYTVRGKGFGEPSPNALEKKLFKAGTEYEYMKEKAHTWDAGDFILYTAIIRENGVTWEAHERVYI